MNDKKLIECLQQINEKIDLFEAKARRKIDDIDNQITLLSKMFNLLIKHMPKEMFEEMKQNGFNEGMTKLEEKARKRIKEKSKIDVKKEDKNISEKARKQIDKLKEVDLR